MKISTAKLSLALNQLKEATSLTTISELERDGGIQRFEYCVELCWKLSKKTLEAQGIVVQTPKETFRAMGKYMNLPDIERWLDFLQARNYSSHLYDESVATWVWSVTKDFPKECELLIALINKAQDL